MPKTNSTNITSILFYVTLLALLLSASAVAEDNEAATREHQAAQLRFAVDSRIAELDVEYMRSTTELRRQFDVRRRNLEENAESQIELSNALAAISRVYQDSLAALQREINGRRSNVYAAQSEANEELITQGAISSETWGRISSIPLRDFPFVPAPTVSGAAVEAAGAEEGEPEAPEEATASQTAVSETSQVEDRVEHGATDCAADRGGIRWYPDRDRDLFGDVNESPTIACHFAKPAGWVDNNYDCDDSDATVNPITGHCPGPRL